MRRFDKKKNIQKLNERLNKKGNSLTENSWADDLPRQERPYNPSVQDDREEELRDMGIHDDSFPDEFKGMYDDEFGPYDPETLDGDPLGPTPDDLQSPIELQHRQEKEAGIRRGMGEDYGEEYTPQDEYDDMFDDPYEMGNDGVVPDSVEYGYAGLTDKYMDTLDTYLMDNPDGDAMGGLEAINREYPDNNIRSLKGIQQFLDDARLEAQKRKGRGLYGEGKGKKMNVISEQSLKAFQNLCGLKLIKEEKKEEEELNEELDEAEMKSNEPGHKDYGKLKNPPHPKDMERYKSKRRCPEDGDLCNSSACWSHCYKIGEY